MRAAIAITSLVVALSLIAPARAAEAPATQPAWSTVARWYGRMSAYDHNYATREPGAFGMALSRPNSKQTSEAAVVVREEVSNYGESRTVVESINWSTQVGDLYYRNKDGTRVPAGSGGRGRGALSGDQLTEPANVPADAIPQARERVEQARQQLREAEQRAADGKGHAAPHAQEADEPVVKAYRAAARELALLDKPDARPEDLERAQEKRNHAAEAFNKWVAEQSEKLAAEYGKSLEAKMKRLQDPAVPDAEKTKLGQEISASGEQLAAAMKQFTDLSDSIANEQRDQDAAREVEEARRQLLRALGHLQDLQAPRSKATARLEIPDRPGDDGNRTVSFEFSLNDPKQLTRFPADVIPLKLIGFKTVLEQDYKPEQWSARRVMRFRGRTAVRGGDNLDEQTITLSESESSGGGQPGLVGGGESRFNGTFTRVPVKQQLVVRGKVLHRIRVPQHEHDLSLLLPEPQGPPATAPGAPSPLDGAIPVAGPVLVEAWTLDPNQLASAAAATRPPDVSTAAQGNDAAFEFHVARATNKVLRLRFTWHNADARLWEMQTLDVNTDDVLKKSIGASSASAAPIPDIARARTVWFRFGGAPMEYPLGVERRGAAVHRDGERTVLRFEGLNSILVNTFVLAAPYLNQNNQAFSLKNVHVPAARLVSASPDFLASRVRARLGVGASGDVPKETATDVKVRGSVVCFPTCLTMALGAMRMISLPDDGKYSDEVGNLAQAVYEYWADRTRAGTSVVALHPEPPWIFPFPPAPDVANAMVAEADKKAASASPVDRALAPGLRDKARALYPKWPYVDADDSHLNKQWLISLGDAKFTFIATSTGDEDLVVGGVMPIGRELYRPWQTVEVVRPYFKDVRKVSSKVYDQADVFSRQRNRQVLNTLGRGAFSIISIDHLDSNGGKGGHIMLLLGAITDNDGFPVRLIVHDPYGDQSQHPGVQGYYAPGYNDDKRLYDKDRSGGNHGTRGRYAPYGAEINSYGGRMYSKWWLVFDPPENKPAPADVRGRMLPSEKWTGGNPPPR